MRPTFANQVFFARVPAKNHQPGGTIRYLYGVPHFSEQLAAGRQVRALFGEFSGKAAISGKQPGAFRFAQQKAPANALQRLSQRKVLAIENGKARKKKKKRRW